MKRPRKVSLVSQTADVLRDQIAVGTLRHTLPGEKKMAANLQVSRKTLRAALAILTSEKVLAQPIPGARRRILKQPEKHLQSDEKRVGVLLPRPLDELHASSQDFFRALRKHLDSKGVAIYYHDYPFLKRRPNVNKLEEMIKSNPADVWMIWEVTPVIVDLISKLGITAVACGGLSEGKIHNVAYDATSAAQHAFHKLLNAGHSRICFACDSLPTARPVLRELLEQKGIKRNDSLHFPSYKQTTRGYIEMLQGLYIRRETPTAFVTMGPRNLITLMTWLASRKLSVPKDVSILHIGSDPIISAITPAISHYSTSFAPLAREMDRVIMNLLEDPQSDVSSKQFFMEYVAGDSVAPPPED